MRLINRLYAFEQDDGSVHYQQGDYLEDGWYIREDAGTFYVYEVPQYGGEDMFVGVCDTFLAALLLAEDLA